MSRQEKKSGRTGNSAHSEKGTAKGGQDAEGRRRAGLVSTSIEKRVRRPPLDRLKGEATRTARGRGSFPQTLRPINTNRSANCSNKARPRSTNFDIGFPCLNAVSIDDPTGILTVSTSDSRRTYPAEVDLDSYAYRLKQRLPLLFT